MCFIQHPCTRVFNKTHLNSNLVWKLVGSITGNSSAITLPDGWKELIIVANANNSTVALGSWHFIAETTSSTPCRYTQGTNVSWITIWLSKTKAQIYQGFINSVDYASTSTMVVYYR